MFSGKYGEVSHGRACALFLIRRPGAPDPRIKSEDDGECDLLRLRS